MTDFSVVYSAGMAGVITMTLIVMFYFAGKSSEIAQMLMVNGAWLVLSLLMFAAFVAQAKGLINFPPPLLGAISALVLAMVLFSVLVQVVIYAWKAVK